MLRPQQNTLVVSTLSPATYKGDTNPKNNFAKNEKKYPNYQKYKNPEAKTKNKKGLIHELN